MYTTGRELWLEDHKERTARGRRARVNSGKILPGNKPAFGYRWRPAKGDEPAHSAYDPDPVTASLVLRIFQTLANGGSLTGIRRTFENEGIHSPKGSPRWSMHTLHDILTNPAYKGEAEAWRIMRVPQKGNPSRKKDGLRPESERIRLSEEVVPPLVPAELWVRANSQLAANQNLSSRRSLDPTHYLMRGFVRCSHCDRALGTKKNRDRGYYRTQPNYARYHSCPSLTMDSQKLDAEVWSLVERIIAHPDRIIQKIMADMASETDPTEQERAALQKALRDIERAKMQTLAIEALDDPEQAAPNIARLKQLAKDHTTLSQQLGELEQRHEGWAQGMSAAHRLMERFEAEQDSWAR